MNESKDQDQLVQKLKSTLDQSVDELDVDTLRQLRMARCKAVAASEKKARPAWWLPVGGLATAATISVLFVTLWLLPAEQGLKGQVPALEDIALLGDDEALEFYEDLDFYLWLDDEQKAG